MTRLRNAVLVAAGAIGVGALVDATFIGTPVTAQEPDQKAEALKAKKLAEGEREAKKMLLLMDTDKSGKVSKQEFMSFMEAEFDRMDINKDGELDVKELTDSRVQVRTRGR
jgi:Ca2+-binding EF-hand superfamily protein